MISSRHPTHARYPEIARARTLIFQNPQILLAAALFYFGWWATKDSASTLAGALFGAGATLIGTWISELNSRQAAALEHVRRHEEARRYFVPELYRTIERVLYVHGRAIPNFTCASAESDIKPSDLQQDFIPYWPVLYPNSAQFHDLSGDEATALVAFYDSLNTLAEFVRDWWNREGQLHVNLFLTILHSSEASLKLAKVCIEKFDLETLCPPPYAAWGTLTSRIDRSLSVSADAMKHHQERWQAKAGGATSPKPLRR